MINRIPTFYTDEQVHDACAYSKSPLKPGMLARKIALDDKFEIKRSLIHPIGFDRLAQTHDENHVRALIAGDKADGFGNLSKKDNKAIRTTVGNFLAAAEWAAAGRQDGNPNTDIIHPGVVWSLTSGFHHAGHDSVGGFCTYEALTLAAFELHKFRGMKTLIIDEDAHWGNGCIDMIERNKMATYCEYVQSDHTHKLGHHDLEKFENQVLTMVRVMRPGIIFYQAGADNWVGDPLGGNLTMEELYLRDVIVMELARDFKIPLVVNLAGGYADHYDDTLQIHLNTGEAMKHVFLKDVIGHPVFPVHAIEHENGVEHFDISDVAQ